MTVQIEKHVKMTLDGTEEVYYHVRYKLSNNWWNRWHYAMFDFAHSDPEVRKIKTLEEAIVVARSIRFQLKGLSHEVTILNEYGEDTRDPY